METEPMLTTVEGPILKEDVNVRVNEQPAQQVAQPKLFRFSLPRTSLATAVRRLVFYAALIAIWELIARSGIWPSYLFPGPSDTFDALASGFSKGQYLEGMLMSLRNVAIGYGLSVVVGVTL